MIEKNASISLSNLNSHLANERTHLSYLRTSLSMISFGVTLNRLSTYLKQIDQESTRLMLNHTALFGIAMVILGILVQFWSVIRYRQVYDDINRSTFKNPIRFVILMTATIMILGLLAVYFMISSGNGMLD